MSKHKAILFGELWQIVIYDFVISIQKLQLHLQNCIT